MTRVIVLLLLVLLTLGAAYYLVMARQPVQNGEPIPLLGGLASESQAINKVIIENNTGVIFSAVKTDTAWTATHLDSVMRFPVDVAQLSEFVSLLTQAHIIEPKTARASQYVLLGVEPVSQVESQSTQVTLVSSNKQWRILLGNIAASGIGQYVREPSQQQSYLMDQTLSVPVTSSEWLQREVITTGLTELDTIVIDNDPAFTFFKGSEGEWLLSENKLPLAYPGVLAHTLNDIINFEYDAVTPLVTLPPEELLSRTITLQGANGKGVTMAVYRANEAESGYQLVLHGDLVADYLNEWVFTLTDYQARALLTDKAELLQQ